MKTNNNSYQTPTWRKKKESDLHRQGTLTMKCQSHVVLYHFHDPLIFVTVPTAQVPNFLYLDTMYRSI